MLQPATTVQQPGHPRVKPRVLDGRDLIAAHKAIAAEKTAARAASEHLRSGISRLDHYLSDVVPGSLVVLGGRPGMGKTSLALSFVEATSIEGRKPSAWIATDCSAEQMGELLLGFHSRVELPPFLAEGDRSVEERTRLDTAALSISDAAIWFVEAANPTVATLRTTCDELIQQSALKLIVIDDIGGLVSADGGQDATTDDSIAVGLRDLARDLGVTVIVLSQISRDLEVRSNKRPRLSDLTRYEGLAQVADAVLFVYRDGYYDKECDRTDAEIIVARNRYGDTRSVNAKFIGELRRFEDARLLD